VWWDSYFPPPTRSVEGPPPCGLAALESQQQALLSVLCSPLTSLRAVGGLAWSRVATVRHAIITLSARLAEVLGRGGADVCPRFPFTCDFFGCALGLQSSAPRCCVGVCLLHAPVPNLCGSRLQCVLVETPCAERGNGRYHLVQETRRSPGGPEAPVCPRSL